MEKINPKDLIPMDIFIDHEPIKVDLVYADKNHPRNIFDETIYHSDARLWTHKDIAAITLLTARTLNKKYGYILEAKDCLRTINAQRIMEGTDIVKAHPEWMEEPRMLAPPGHGGHPRAMAIDVCILDTDEQEIDMGTPFDDMSPESYRSCNTLSEKASKNRELLEAAFMTSAGALGHDFLPLPAEWWDFRFPTETYHQYAPLSDSDLPLQMQMTSQIENNTPDFDDTHFRNLADEITSLVDKHYADL